MSYKELGGFDKLKKALFDFSQCLIIEEYYIPALKEKAIVLCLLNKIEEALEIISYCITKEPSATVYHNRGVMYFNIGMLDLAESDFQNALLIKPDNENSLIAISEIAKRKIK